MSVTKQTFGCVAMLLQGVVLNSILAILRIVKERGWHEVTLYACSSIMSAIFIGGLMSFRGIRAPAKGERLWVVLTGTSWAASFVVLTFSVWMKTPLGDVAALTSLNCVAAAFLGFICLGEPLSLVTFIAMFLSVAGAVFIAKPSAIFGCTGESSIGTPLGMALAAASGFFDACILIFSRLSANCDVWNHGFWALTQGSIAFIVVAWFPIADSLDFEMLLGSPVIAAAVIGCLFVLDVSNIVMYCTAAQLIPAALSSTLNVASNMIVGYIMQVLVFGVPLDAFSVLGACLMMSAVLLSSYSPEKSEQELLEEHPLMNRGDSARGLQKPIV